MNRNRHSSKGKGSFQTSVRYARIQVPNLDPVKKARTVITPKSKPSKTTTLNQVTDNQRDEETSLHLRNNGIDKLEFTLVYGIRVDYLEAKAKSLGFSFRRFRLSKKHAIEIAARGGERVIVELLVQNATTTKRVITNPSHFDSFYNYVNFLECIFGRNHIDSAKISRLDVAVDLPETFNSILSGLIISGKSTYSSYVSKGGSASGLNFGKGDEVYVVYDKERQLKECKGKIDIGRPLTRIEIHFKGKKLIVQRIKDLPCLTATFKVDRDFKINKSFDFFNKIELREVSFIEEEKCKSKEEFKKLIEFKVMVRELGFFVARKRLNKHSHFERNYGHLFSVEDFGYDLNKLLLERLKVFFGQKLKKVSYEL